MTRKRLLALLLGLAVCALLLWAVARSSAPQRPIAEVETADGRIIVIESVTFGTNHIVGRNSFLVDRFGPWMPPVARELLQPKVPRSTWTTAQDSLVVWVNAISSQGRTNVDCQDVRVEFEDSENGLWGPQSGSWGGFDNKFSRVGYLFEAYPRASQKLTLRLVPWGTNAPVSVSFVNPRPASAKNWIGEPLPARRKIGDMEIVLAGLTAVTTGGEKKYWETPCTYWVPEWQILSDGKPALGWREPEWSATDAFGNRGQRLGIRQPVLRFSAKFLPVATNLAATERVVSLPNAQCSPNATNTLWFRTNSVHGREIVAIGLRTATMTYFTDGRYDPKPPMAMGPTRGGAPTGWIASSRRISPTKVRTVRGHYADRPVIYLQCLDRDISVRLGIRLRDSEGRVWPTTREGQGSGIIPFMLDVPADVTTVVPEIVLLKPVQAEFTVRTSSSYSR